MSTGQGDTIYSSMTKTPGESKYCVFSFFYSYVGDRNVYKCPNRNASLGYGGGGIGTQKFLDTAAKTLEAHVQRSQDKSPSMLILLADSYTMSASGTGPATTTEPNPSSTTAPPTPRPAGGSAATTAPP